jgi:hypothetical protein
MADTKLSALTAATDLTSVNLYGEQSATSKKIPASLFTAGTKTYAVFTALDGNPPASDFATFDTKNSIPVLTFSATATNRTFFTGKLPEAAVVSSGLKVFLHWIASGATSGNAIWNIEWEKSTGQDLDSDGWDATVTSATAACSATDGAMAATEITCTNIDSVVAGDVFRVRVSRLGADASDTLTQPAQLVLVEVRGAA